VCLFGISLQISVQVSPGLSAQLGMPKNVLRTLRNLDLEII
jgi:hypothetical protein